MLDYAKFMNELLSGMHKLKYNDNIALAQEYITIIQRKLPPKLTKPGRFTILCYIGSLTIGHALCDLEARTNLMLLSMV